MKYLFTFSAVFLSSMFLSINNAQSLDRSYSLQNADQQPQKFQDKNGNFYYLDSNGNPYYIDQQGYAYYLDSKGNPYYIDQQGYPYYLDSKGNPYYLDQQGYAYYLDSKGNSYYIDQQGYAYYLDSKGNPYYLDQKKEKNTTTSYDDDVYKTKASPNSESTNYSTRRLYQYDNSSLTYLATSVSGYDKFRLALGGGYAFRLGERQRSTNAQVDQALKDIMHGFNFDADIQFFYKQEVGIGATFNYLQTSASLYNTKQTFIYVGPSFVGKTDIGKSFSLIYNIGVGPLFFKETSNEDYDYSKTAVGIYGGFSGEYKISNNFGLGLKIYYTFGTIGSVNYNGYNYKLNERQSVSSFGFTGFVSFRTK